VKHRPDRDQQTRDPGRAASRHANRVRVAMVGTFDLENLGDLLFPFVARRELERRLEKVEVELFSYRSIGPPLWPLEVQSIHMLAPRLDAFDLVLVGGGHLVRGEDYVAPGYTPTDPRTAHPYGLWLTPTLLAMGAGVPVAWNAIGALDTVPDPVHDLTAVAIGGVEYLGVRDLDAARLVRSWCPTAEPTVVPDTVFGIHAVLDDATVSGARDLLASAGVVGPYVVVQPSQLLAPHADVVEQLAAAAVEQGLVVLELPCGPCHGDAPGQLALRAPTAHLDAWPHPLLSAAILSGAEAIVATSLHAGIIASASGVPLFRPPVAPGSKYELLVERRGVRLFPADGAALVDPTFGRAEVSSDLVEKRALLARHWDEVAALTDRRAGARPRALVAELLDTLPAALLAFDRAALEQQASATEALRVERLHGARELAQLRDELAAEVGRSEHLQALLARRSARSALRVADAMGRLRRRGRDVTPPA
jgi:lipopolysaccharide transport system ATP-binding protein